MPLIQVKLIERVFTDAQERNMMKKLTDAMVSIEGENMRPVTWVLVEEVTSGHCEAADRCRWTSHLWQRSPATIT